MKILVTGATGFIGNHVILKLLETKNKVIATSKNKNKAKSYKWFNKVKYISYDFNEKRTNLYSHFHKPDILIDLAWDGLPNYKEKFHIIKNFPLHFNFISNLIKAGLKNVNVAGTCFEYGMQKGCLSEKLKSKPIVSYAIAKDKLRKQLEKLQINYKYYLKWIRIFYLYGPGQNEKSILPTLKKALNNNEKFFNMSGGEQVRDYLSVEKAAGYIVKIAMQNKISGIINCCSSKPITIKKLVINYLKKNKKKIKLNLGQYPYVDYEPMSYWGDNTKLFKILKCKK
jgi:nucleoside-diphosphate-sugar epimerase